MRKEGECVDLYHQTPRRDLFDLVVQQHQAGAYGYALSLLGDAQMAEDATQKE